MLYKYLNIPNDLWVGIYKTGSSVICNPPVLDTDEDYVIYTNKESQLRKWLLANGVTQSCEDKEEYDLESEFMSCYRKDNINLIVVYSKKTFDRWVYATKLAKKLNLLKKEQRITLFKFVLYGEI